LQRIDELQTKFERLQAQQGFPERVAPQLPMVFAFFNAPGRVWVSLVCVLGSLDGYKLVATGAPNTAEFFTLSDYIGMRPVTAQDRARIQRYIGADRVDLFVRFRDCAEAQ
jgi:hypothetical protein